MFQGLRIAPTVTVDPADGRIGFSFGVGHAEGDIDSTIEMLLDLLQQSRAQDASELERLEKAA